MDPNFQAKLEDFGKILLQDGPGALRFIVSIMKVFPKNTVVYKAGLGLEQLLAFAGVK